MKLDVEKIVREYIDKTIHMSLGTSVNDKPWVCEVHFVYDDDLNIYWRSLESRRHSRDVAKNPNVAGNIVKQHELNEDPHGIYFEGVAELIKVNDAKDEVFALFKNRFDADESIIEDSKQSDGHKFYKVTVQNWYAFGKFGGGVSLKHKLEWNGGAR